MVNVDSQITHMQKTFRHKWDIGNLTSNVKSFSHNLPVVTIVKGG